tara:strand:- start:34 stop:561 length:528 start_codon:yes stop_codon:yes gene_type:complete
MSRDCQEVVDNKKKCSGCGSYKELALFRKQVTAKSGRKSRCTECAKLKDIAYTSIEKNRLNSARWRKENKDRLKKYNKGYRESHGNAERIRIRNKIMANARFRMYTNSAYAKSIASMFEEGMSFDNYGEWELDHVIPVTAWMDKGVTDFDVINGIVNLMPLWKKDNQAKSNNLNN